ncbi:MAG: hypothetical protein ACOYM3_14380 [Terrimicrobiaceae bacterium]
MGTSHPAIPAHFRESGQVLGKADIEEGDGSKEAPFVFAAAGLVYSTRLQARIIDVMYGEGTYDALGQRNYYYSPRGKSGNKDLCEHVLFVSGRRVSVWFDLYRVTQFVLDISSDPAFKQEMDNWVNSDPAIKQAFDDVVNAGRQLEEERAHSRKSGTNQSGNIAGKSGCVLLLTLTLGLLGICVYLIV